MSFEFDAAMKENVSMGASRYATLLLLSKAGVFKEKPK